ncbi:MAG: hypothetical protein KDD10_06080 [Phaeodactylibacter sp.]|nr:hypothetical protein [Phaeodactylibacter sp.]MCB9298920.1 hypothetical protein [Lewinellaceae bacterium]
MKRLEKNRLSLSDFLSGKKVAVITAEQQKHVKGGGGGEQPPFIATEDITDP